MIELNKKIQAQFDKMCATGKLFRSSLTGDTLWEIYLNGFVNDPIFRDPESSVHCCNLCKNFIRRYGNIVSIDENYNIVTIFDVVVSGEYEKSMNDLSKALKNSSVSDVFFETFGELNNLNYESCSKHNSVFALGLAKNFKRYTKEESEKFGVVKPNEIRTFNHFHLSIPSKFVDISGKSAASIAADYKSAKEVFQRSMVEIPIDTLLLVKDLINQGSLLDGKAHLFKIEKILPLKRQYDMLSQNQKDNWCWVTSYNLPIAKFKNELIGTLCTELAEGRELNTACQAWNKRVDPANYMKAVSPFTEKMRQEAIKTLQVLNCEDSFDRRFATIDDIKASEIKHINAGDGALHTVSILDSIKSTSTRHKRSEFDGVEEVSIETFMNNILPGCTSVEAFLTNEHTGNMVSLTTAKNKASKNIFKWDNNYSWTFNGNLAGKSQIKEAVKSAGGKVDGILRFSISWNEDGNSYCDFDAHCKTPVTEICYNHVKDYTTRGFLDVDMIRPTKMGVENITWEAKQYMQDGEYLFFTHLYDGGINNGFKAEIEVEGEVYQYEVSERVSYKNSIKVATVTLKNGVFSIKHHLPEIHTSKELYGLQTNEFHKVNLICLTPNHWGDNSCGNKHYLFMLDKCKSPNPIRSFHCENLIPELLQHRKVLEPFGAATLIESTDKQLSGLGFNATVRDTLVVRVQGSFKRVLKIKF